MFLRKLFIFTGILFACVDIAYTQSREVSIAECINIALQNHPDLMASLENQNGALADYHVAKAANRVNINATANTVEYLKEGRSSSQANVPGRDTAIGLFAGLAATYNIYDPRRNTNIDVKRVSIDYAKMNSVKVRETIVKDVKVSYYNYAMERET
ncbi:MAG TPA: TolC family protein, partial [Spirochaetota bacterium]|nr:TolC family protein [Spirochaetota bacterium]